MRQKLVTLIFIIFSVIPVFSQKEANIWYFGEYAGLNFNSGVPTPLFDGQLSTAEGVATISDKNGNLLFYTEGTTIWNKNHNIMQNGTGLYGNSSATQSAIIVPQPGHENIYYIFTVDQMATGGTYGLCYSIVNIDLAGGQGEVILKNVNLLPSYNSTEKIAATKHSNGNDVWIISHGWKNNTFYAYLLTSNGLNTSPVISNVGMVHESNNGYDNHERAGYLKISPYGTFIACALYEYIANCPIEMLNFDSNSGHVYSTAKHFTDEIPWAYGIEFSPDESKLYACGPGTDAYLFQYNINAGDGDAILSSKKLIASGGGFGALQVGSDKKIYTARFGKSHLSVINNPDSSYLNCNYIENGCSLGGRLSTHGLPAFLQSFFTNFNAYSNTPICEGDTLFLSADTIIGATYEWTGPNNFHSTLISTYIPNPSLNSSGTYVVTATKNNFTYTDSVEVVINQLPFVYLGGDTTLCSGTELTLNASSSGNLSYLWQDGSSQSTYLVTEPGTYWVSVTNSNNCISRDTITIQYSDIKVNLGNDTTLCTGTELTLNAYSLNAVSYLWQDNSSQSTYRVTEPGTYWVSVTNSNGCINRDTIVIQYDSIISVNLGNDTVICSNKSYTLSPGNFLTYIWQDGSNSPYYTVDHSGVYWVTVSGEGGCLGSDTISVTLFNPPSINIGNDTIICPGELINLDPGEGYFTYLWQDGSTQQTYQVNNAGQYWVEVFDGNCTVSDTIIVSACTLPSNILVPNVFTPNSDGVNDSFYAIGNNINDFEITIYNRWGQAIFHANTLSDSWNGKFKGKDCPTGVYFYIIFYKDDLKKKHHMEGSITLIR